MHEFLTNEVLEYITIVAFVGLLPNSLTWFFGSAIAKTKTHRFAVKVPFMVHLVVFVVSFSLSLFI